MCKYRQRIQRDAEIPAASKCIVLSALCLWCLDLVSSGAVAVLHRKSKYMARVCVVEVLWPGVVVSVCARAPNDRV